MSSYQTGPRYCRLCKSKSEHVQKSLKHSFRLFRPNRDVSHLLIYLRFQSFFHPFSLVTKPKERAMTPSAEVWLLTHLAVFHNLCQGLRENSAFPLKSFWGRRSWNSWKLSCPKGAKSNTATSDSISSTQQSQDTSLLPALHALHAPAFVKHKIALKDSPSYLIDIQWLLRVSKASAHNIDSLKSYENDSYPVASGFSTHAIISDAWHLGLDTRSPQQRGVHWQKTLYSLRFVDGFNFARKVIIGIQPVSNPFTIQSICKPFIPMETSSTFQPSQMTSSQTPLSHPESWPEKRWASGAPNKSPRDTSGIHQQIGYQMALPNIIPVSIY